MSVNKVVITRSVMARMRTSNSNGVNLCVWGRALRLGQAGENAKLPVGEEKKYSGYKNQIFVSGLLPSRKCPLPSHLGASQCARSSSSKGRASEREGGTQKEEAAETQCGLYRFHAAVHHCPLTNTITAIGTRAGDKNRT